MKRKIVLTGIINYKDEYLVVQRSKNDDFLPGVWEFPGGNIEDGETIYDALKRELFEETGFVINDNVKLINYYDEIKEKNDKYHYIELDFLINVDNKNIDIKLSNEHDSFCWIKKDSKLIDEFIQDKLKNI